VLDASSEIAIILPNENCKINLLIRLRTKKNLRYFSEELWSMTPLVSMLKQSVQERDAFWKLRPILNLWIDL